MTKRSWWSLFRRSSPSTQRPRSVKPSPSFRPRLEQLEDMVLLSGITFEPTHLLSSNPIKSQASGSTPSGLSPAQVLQAYGFNSISFQNGTVKAFALWSPKDEGYVAATLGIALATGKVKPETGAKFTAGSMGERSFRDKGVVITGPPVTFTKSNIEQFKF